MSKIIICADLHLHNNRQFASRVDWIDIGINVLNQVISYSKENGNIPIFILGDVFQLHDRVPSIVLNAFCDCIAEATDIEFFLLLGTHNKQMAKEISFKQAGRFKNVHVISEVQEFGGSGVIKFFIPYEKDEVEFINKLKPLARQAKFYAGGTDRRKILFLHQEINFTKYGDYVFKNRITKALFKEFDWVFSGHIHQYQEITKNIIYTGSLHQLNFGECNNTNYFLVYDSATNSYEKIETIAPKFLVKDYSEKSLVTIEENPLNGNFLKLTVPGDINRNEIRKKLYDNGCLGVIFEEEKTDKEVVKKLDMNPTDNYITAFNKYMYQSTFNNKEILNSLGTQILKEVIGNG